MTGTISIPRQAGIYVRRARESQGLTRVQLARKSGVSERSLASLELGDAEGIRLDKLLLVLGALGLTLRVQTESSDACTSDSKPEQPSGQETGCEARASDRRPAAEPERQAPVVGRPHASPSLAPDAPGTTSLAALHRSLIREVVAEQCEEQLRG